MSSLNWEHTYRYAYTTEELNEGMPVAYELWGLPYKDRQWYHDPLARVDKKSGRWELTTRNTHGFQQVRGTYKTLKEAKAMGIAFITLEGIKHE